jgi:hypothetical protein
MGEYKFNCTGGVFNTFYSYFPEKIYFKELNQTLMYSVYTSDMCMYKFTHTFLPL